MPVLGGKFFWLDKFRPHSVLFYENFVDQVLGDTHLAVQRTLCEILVRNFYVCYVKLELLGYHVVEFKLALFLMLSKDVSSIGGDSAKLALEGSMKQ